MASNGIASDASAARPGDGTASSASAPTLSGRRPRLPVPVHARGPLPRWLQVPPLLLAVRDRCAPPLRARARSGARRLAASPLQPLAPRRGRLRRTAEGLPMILASPLTPLEDVLRSILEWLGPHGALGLPWAWSIVALTVLVLVAMVPLTVKQIHSMQAMQAHMPEMKAIQQRYKQDKQKRNEELMKFYRDNNVNPAAPCLPLLFQFPVFIALYLVLRHSSELIHGGDKVSWLGLVPDITGHANAHWTGYLLLTIYVASQLASTYFMSATMDKTQRTLMMILPVAFVPVLVNFPVGLVLYWVTTNLWTVGQGVVTRRLVPKKPPAPPKRSSRTPARAPDLADGAKEEPVSAEPAPAAAPRRVKRKKKKKKARR